MKQRSIWLIFFIHLFFIILTYFNLIFIIGTVFCLILALSKKQNNLINWSVLFLYLSPLISLIIAFLSGGIGNGVLLIPYMVGVTYGISIILGIIGLLQRK